MQLLWHFRIRNQVLTNQLYDKMYNNDEQCDDRAIDKFSECQDNMSFHVQKWPDISNDWSDIPSKKEAKKKEIKRRGGGKEGKK